MVNLDEMSAVAETAGKILESAPGTKKPWMTKEVPDHKNGRLNFYEIYCEF